jgi:hypothetical protein
MRFLIRAGSVKKLTVRELVWLGRDSKQIGEAIVVNRDTRT